MDWRDRIVINPAIHHGDPCIKGTRVPLSVIVGSIADGDTFEQVLDVYPHLTADDIRGALRAGRGLTAMTERTVIDTSAEVMHGTPVFAGTHAAPLGEVARLHDRRANLVSELRVRRSRRLGRGARSEGEAEDQGQQGPR